MVNFQVWQRGTAATPGDCKSPTHAVNNAGAIPAGVTNYAG
jgi:hypothetical protein